MEISVMDAMERGISTGDTIRAWNTTGEVLCLAKVTSDVRPGVCVLAKGLWRKHTANGYTANALIPPKYADLGGQGAFNDARIQVAKA
jgi:anaerobic selenocysteine-containing dehydrogenase